MSAVAGVLEANGSVRIVIGPRDNMWCHVNAGERLFVLTGMEVREPVEWGEIGVLVQMVQEHVARCLSDTGHSNQRQRLAVDRSV